MMIYRCDVCGKSDHAEKPGFVNIGDILLCKDCYRNTVQNSLINDVLEIIDEVANDDLIDDAIKINSVRNRVVMWMKGGE